MKQKLVVVGNGMAPGRMLERLCERAPDRYEVCIFNAEPRVNYDRILLSPVLAGDKRYEDIIIHDEAWYAARGISLHRGERVTAIDRDARTVTSAGGIVAPYDALVLATGSSPFVLPVPGHDLPGVVTYRDLDDVEAMLRAAAGGGDAVVIGGGLLGLEAAAGLHAQGMRVSVLHLMPTLMERQLDPAAGFLLERAIAARGIRVITEANTAAILGESRVEGVALEDGTRLAADLVVMAAGIRPAAELARAAGLEVGRGIQVDDALQTSDARIFALGECAEHRGTCYGLVAPLYEMAQVLAERLSGGDALYAGSVTATKLKVTGIDLYSAGDFADGHDREEIVLRDAAAGVYKRLVIRNDTIIGAVLYGDTGDGPWFFDLIRRATPIGAMRDTVVFGQAYQGGTAADPAAAVAALPDDAEICGCNGVCKSRIVDAIRGQGLRTLDAVRAHTKASSSCGTCSGLVEQLLALTLGADYAPAAITAMCHCTTLGHDEVRRLIRARELKSIPQVMQELEWTSSCGCAKCRPALNYYLVCDWPDEYADDYQSRFINERAHANIQKDGTYSVVPRMWGGVTSAAELRAIADVVDRFRIPTVKVTGGQRIDLLGIAKQDLPAVWADLGKAGFVSGHAYAKGLRTVKTCVGTDWCRFGTQDSTALGIRIERFMWGSWTPHKVKMAVSGCPRNCAEATCKDIGVVCVDSGFEIHYAGAAGLEVRRTDLLTTVRSEDEVIEFAAALLQMYREQAHYLERIHKWAKRVGHAVIVAQIVDDAARRRAYFDRFVRSQRVAQVDPWAQRVAGKHHQEYAPLGGFRASIPAPETV
jgi:nitrite reductase (NADH) large subunit